MANTKPTLADAEAALKKMDTDKNGRVSRAEFIKAMSQYGFSEAGLKQVLDKIDTNKDGTISPQEYLSHL